MTLAPTTFMALGRVVEIWTVLGVIRWALALASMSWLVAIVTLAAVLVGGLLFVRRDVGAR